MAVTLYCEVEHLKSIISAFGVALRTDDLDATSSTNYAEDAIERATVDVNFYLLQNYEVAAIAASAWVKWCTAAFAVVALCKRRGNSVPASLQAELDRYLEALKAISEGKAMLPGDTGPVPPRFDNTPGVSNMRVDSRFRANVRRVPQTSTQTQQSPNRRGFDLNFWPYPFPFS